MVRPRLRENSGPWVSAQRCARRQRDIPRRYLGVRTCRHKHLVTRFEIPDLVANAFDDTGSIEAKDGRVLLVSRNP